jgi:hypothetical protein
MLVRDDPFSIQLAKADGKTQIKRACRRTVAMDQTRCESDISAGCYL